MLVAIYYYNSSLTSQCQTNITQQNTLAKLSAVQYNAVINV